jgi:hypothetical protein
MSFPQQVGGLLVLTVIFITVYFGQVAYTAARDAVTPVYEDLTDWIRDLREAHYEFEPMDPDDPETKAVEQSLALLPELMYNHRAKEIKGGITVVARLAPSYRTNTIGDSKTEFHDVCEEIPTKRVPIVGARYLGQRDSEDDVDLQRFGLDDPNIQLFAFDVYVMNPDDFSGERGRMRWRQWSSLREVHS